MEGWSNSPKIKLEMPEMCSTCDKLRQHNEWLYSRCQIYEQQNESLVKINAENGSSLQESQQKIEELNQVVALLTQQIAEKIAEISMLRVESDENKKGKVKENNKEEDVESCSEMDNSEHSDDIQVFEEAEDEETDATLDEKQVKTCAWMVRDGKGASARCGRVFPSSEDLASHSKEAHLHMDCHFNYICLWDGCKRNGAPFHDKRMLMTHFRIHSGERPFRCSFKGCDRAFAQMTALKWHSNTHSNSRATYPCLDPECHKVFTHKIRMMSHYRTKHTGERIGFLCPVEGCGKVFGTDHVLRKHLCSHRYHCRFPRCHQYFASKQSLNEHLEMHGSGRTSLK